MHPQIQSRLTLATAVLAAVFPAGPARSQTPTPTTPMPSQATAPSQADLALLSRAVAAIKREKAWKTLSDMQMSAAGQGMTMSFREHFSVVSQRPGRFNSAVTLEAPDGTPGTRYAVASDGTKVWIYQPGTHSYSVLARAAFEQNDIFATGLFASLLTDTASSGHMDLDSLARSGLKLQVGTNTDAGTSYHVFGISDPKQGYRLRFAVDPGTAMMHQISLSGRQKQVTFTVTETIAAQSPLPVQPAGLFHFSPPPGAKHVPQLSIGPF